MVSERNIPLLIQVLALVLCLLLCSVLGTLLSFSISGMAGVDMGQMTGEEMEAHRWVIRLLLGIGQLSTFLLPGLLFCLWLYKKDWKHTVWLRNWPPTQEILMAGMAMLLSLGLVAYSSQVNQGIPLPDWAISAEADTRGLVMAVLRMDDVWELLAGLIIVALLPALGEEWIFRGILQTRLLSALGNGHAAVWLSAIVFSAIHVQFQGFLPRMLLGAILGYLLLYSRNLWLPITAHFINNAYQVAGYYIQSKAGIAADLDPSKMPKVSPWVGLFSLLAIIGMMWWLKKYYEKKTDEAIL